MGPRQMSVCFSGYRPEKLPWGEDESDPRCAALKKRLYDAAESACAQGYRHFICGMARGVDFYACEAVLLLRRDYPDVTVAGGSLRLRDGGAGSLRRRVYAAAEPVHGGSRRHAHRRPRRTARRYAPHH